MTHRMSTVKLLAMGDSGVGDHNEELLERACHVVNSSPTPRYAIHQYDLQNEMKEKARLGINFNRSVTMSLASRWEVVNRLTVEFLEEVISLNDQLTDEASKQAKQVLSLILTRTQRLGITSRIEQMGGLLMHVTFYRTVLQAKIKDLNESTTFLLHCADIMCFSTISQIMSRYYALRYTLQEILEEREQRLALLEQVTQYHQGLKEKSLKDSIELHNSMAILKDRLKALRADSADMERFIEYKEGQEDEAQLEEARIRISISTCYQSIMNYKELEGRASEPMAQLEEMGTRLTVIQSAVKMVQEGLVKLARDSQGNGDTDVKEEQEKARRSSVGNMLDVVDVDKSSNRHLDTSLDHEHLPGGPQVGKDSSCNHPSVRDGEEVRLAPPGPPPSSSEGGPSRPGISLSTPVLMAATHHSVDSPTRQCTTRGRAFKDALYNTLSNQCDPNKAQSTMSGNDKCPLNLKAGKVNSANTIVRRRPGGLHLSQVTALSDGHRHKTRKLFVSKLKPNRTASFPARVASCEAGGPGVGPGTGKIRGQRGECRSVGERHCSVRDLIATAKLGHTDLPRMSQLAMNHVTDVSRLYYLSRLAESGEKKSFWAGNGSWEDGVFTPASTEALFKRCRSRIKDSGHLPAIHESSLMVAESTVSPKHGLKPGARSCAANQIDDDGGDCDGDVDGAGDDNDDEDFVKNTTNKSPLQGDKCVPPCAPATCVKRPTHRRPKTVEVRATGTVGRFPRYVGSTRNRNISRLQPCSPSLPGVGGDVGPTRNRPRSRFQPHSTSLLHPSSAGPHTHRPTLLKRLVQVRHFRNNCLSILANVDLGSRSKDKELSQI